MAKKAKIERFDLEVDTSQWKLSEELAEYANKKLNIHIPEKQIEEGIMKEFPIPSNIIIQKELDAFMKHHVEDKKNKTCLAVEKSFQSIQNKIGLMLGPLSAMWEFIEKERNLVTTKNQQEDLSDSEKDELKEPLETSNQMCNLLEMIILLLGQTERSQ